MNVTICQFRFFTHVRRDAAVLLDLNTVGLEIRPVGRAHPCEEYNLTKTSKTPRVPNSHILCTLFRKCSCLIRTKKIRKSLQIKLYKLLTASSTSGDSPHHLLFTPTFFLTQIGDKLVNGLVLPPVSSFYMTIVMSIKRIWGKARSLCNTCT